MVNRDNIAREFLLGDTYIVVSTIDGSKKFKEYVVKALLAKDNSGICETTLHIQRYGKDNSRGKFFSVHVTKDSSKELYADTLYAVESVLSRFHDLKGSLIKVEIAFYRYGNKRASVVETTQFTKILPYKN